MVEIAWKAAMTTTAEALDRIPRDIGKKLIEGKPIRMFAARARFAAVDGQNGLEIGALMVPGGTDLQREISQKLCQLLHDRIAGIPSSTITILQVISKFLPDAVVCQIDIFIRMQEDGSRLWTAAGMCLPAAMALPGVPEAVEQAGREALELVTGALP